MRLDKYLKLSRVIKRRSVANEVCDQGRVSLNGKVAKAATPVSVGDLLEIRFGTGPVRLRVLSVQEVVRKNEAQSMYELEGAPAATEDGGEGS